MRIINAFPFFNELEMLEDRLKYLYDHVDYFLIVECDHTYSGMPKPLHFLENIDRYKCFNDKIIYYPYYAKNVHERYDFSIKPSPGSVMDLSMPQWQFEIEQRNNIGMVAQSLQDDDMIIFNDLDEIPNFEIFDDLKNIVAQEVAVVLEQQDFYYNLRSRFKNPLRVGSASLKKHFCSMTTVALRAEAVAQKYRIVPNAGWHLSYFMSKDKMAYKLESFAHQEFNFEYWKNPDRIQKCIDNKIDLFERPYELEDTKREEFPESFMKVFGKYYDYA